MHATSQITAAAPPPLCVCIYQLSGINSESNGYMQTELRNNHKVAHKLHIKWNEHSNVGLKHTNTESRPAAAPNGALLCYFLTPSHQALITIYIGNLLQGEARTVPRLPPSLNTELFIYPGS